MTKKDYEIIAGVLRRANISLPVKATLAVDFANALEEDNPRFNEQRFIDAVIKHEPVK